MFGHHAVVNEELSCRKEEGNISDPYPVAFIKSGIIVGHVRHRISAACNLFICDRASEKGPSGHKLHLITKQLISWVLQNRFMLCKL